MQNTKYLFLVSLVMVVSENCTAMQQDLVHQVATNNFTPTYKKCLSDALRMTFGASVCVSSLLALMVIYRTNNHDDPFRTTFANTINNPTALNVAVISNVMAFSGIFGIYAIYKFFNLVQHSWVLALHDRVKSKNKQR